MTADVCKSGCQLQPTSAATCRPQVTLDYSDPDSGYWEWYCPTHQFGRVYTQDDLRSTGQVDIAQALRMLDPSIR